MMKISDRGLAEIASHEGIVLSPYKDSSGLWTIGIGHLLEQGDDKQDERRSLSLEEALELFIKDISRFEARVRKSFRVSLTQEQFDAAVSFDFNTGAIDRAVWVRHVNEEALEEARKSFMHWCRPPEIIPRREKECKLFFEGQYSGNGYVYVYPVSPSGIPVYHAGIRTYFADMVKTVAAFSSGGGFFRSEGSAQSAPDIIPLLCPQETHAGIRALWFRFQHLVPDRRHADPVKLLLLRGYYEKEMSQNKRNGIACYNDALFVLSPEGLHSFNGNADPSAQRAGVAQIKAPQAVLYKPGLHGYAEESGSYPAFRQHGPCTVLRRGAGEDTGIFFVNIHKGKPDNPNSSGGITLPPQQWEEFYGLVKGLLVKYRQEDFFLTLVTCSKERLRRSIFPSGERNTIETKGRRGEADPLNGLSFLIGEEKGNEPINE